MPGSSAAGAVSVLIVNFNGGDVTPACLESLPAGVDAVVVDNGSKDGSPDAIAARHSAVRLIRNRANRGFAAAVNQGIEASRGRYVCLLNNDARLSPGSLESLVGYMDGHPDCGMAAPQLLHEDGRRQHSFDNFPSLATAFLNKSLLRRILPGRYPSKRQEFTEPRDVESVIGACMIVRRDLIDRIGPLDEAYFLFLEETDWCLRCRRAGYSVRFVPSATVTHLQGRARDKVRFRARIEYTRSLFTYFRRNLPRSYPVLRVLFPLRTLLEFVVQTLALPFKGVARRWAETAAVLGWQLACCPRSWGLSKGADPKFVKLRDGWTVAEGHLESFADFDRAVERVRAVGQEGSRRTLEALAGGKTYLVRMEGKGEFAGQVRNAVFGSAAERRARGSRRLLATGIPCVPVVAWGDRSFGAAVVVEKPAGGQALEGLLRDPALPARERRVLLRAYGRFVRRIHDAGIAPPELGPARILRSGGRLLLLDDGGARCGGRPLPERRRLDALAKLALPRPDLRSMLLGYTDADPSGRERLARALLR